MSLQLINQYYNRVDKKIQYGGSNKETAIRNEFYNLINHYCERKHLDLIPELDYKLKNGKTVTPDGTVKNALRLNFGFWESKANVVLEDEIEDKIRKGYPLTNIIFEDSKRIILYQDGERKLFADMRKADELDKVLNQFIAFEPREVTEFTKAIEAFKQDIPLIVKGLREMIEKQEQEKGGAFLKNRQSFLEICQESINPSVSVEDVNEMLIQHILTEEIFLAIFSDAQFLRENNIARELYKVEETFFTGKTKYDTLQGVKHYYDAIKAAAAPIADHHEKQTFLKVIYENFYKAYNPKGADRLGIVYTPSEIIKFMIEGTDYLLEKHFGKTLASKNVEILDPATGTGTYICDLIEYLPKQDLQHKFLHELHANEIAILPYYIANLNIEYTYRQKMGDYQQFQNICFVDTLENIDSLQNRRDKAKQMGLSFNFSPENAERIKKQNAKKISVIIGNPPYNAKQENYNYLNANKAYAEIDSRIRATYVKEGTAQNQIVLYDMYVRFLRWATDRLNDNGCICFITNNSYLEGRTFDGFRKSISNEYQFAYFIDLGGDIRKLSGRDGIFLNEKNTIFGAAAAVGISICFLVKDKTKENQSCQIQYIHPTDIRATRKEKLEFLTSRKFWDIPFTRIIPDAKNNWINQTDNNFEELLPLIDKEVKSGKDIEGKAIFKLFSRGIATQRDAWVYDFSAEKLAKKIKYFAEIYMQTFDNKDFIDKFKIKWDRELESYLQRKIKKEFTESQIIPSLYRPYSKQFFYFDKHFNGMTYQWFDILPIGKSNASIGISGLGSNKDFQCLATSLIPCLDSLEKSQYLPFYVYDKITGERFDNITRWGLEQFTDHYQIEITKEAIFHYVYAVLHNPAYRKKYEQNLKRDFPRIPFYEDFEQWATWGKALMDLHIGYENTELFPLNRVERAITQGASSDQRQLFARVEEVEPLYKTEVKIRPKLKADKETGIIEIDEQTTLTGIPTEAWAYKLGNRSALEWILDQYKESKPTDPTILEKFNHYRFADYKEEVIVLLQKVCTVSMETMKIIRAMEGVEY